MRRFQSGRTSPPSLLKNLLHVPIAEDAKKRLVRRQTSGSRQTTRLAFEAFRITFFRLFKLRDCHVMSSCMLVLDP
jgi:hypothetical protein